MGPKHVCWYMRIRNNQVRWKLMVHIVGTLKKLPDFEKRVGFWYHNGQPNLEPDIMAGFDTAGSNQKEDQDFAGSVSVIVISRLGVVNKLVKSEFVCARKEGQQREVNQGFWE